MKLSLNDAASVAKNCEAFEAIGYVKQVVGLSIEAQGPVTSVGDLCLIEIADGAPLKAEVVGFRDDRVILMPLGEMRGLHPGCRVISTNRPLTIRVGKDLLGRIIDGSGEVIDEKGKLTGEKDCVLDFSPPHPLRRMRISEILETGISAIDGLLTVGKGQRVGIFSGSGVGKSTLFGMMARQAQADVNVIGLIGERGREVKDFIEKDLGPEGLEKTVLVVSTSDQPALLRLNAARIAMTVAEHFRESGKNVLLMIDSITRIAFAQREVGLASGEPPATKGYPPSVFAFLPRLLERSGNSEKGTLTGLFTVLVESDDLTEPISDIVRSVVDGHIVLSRKLASHRHYPPIDIGQSVSRLMTDLVSEEHLQAANTIKELLATYHNAEDLIRIGAYSMGSNPEIDLAIKKNESIGNFLRQDSLTKRQWPQTLHMLQQLCEIKKSQT